jgi:hypothetical protein
VTLEDFTTGIRTRHESEVADGLHDDRCEWRPNGHFICNCAKRRRLAAGSVEPPGDLEFPPPTCSHCYRDLEYDGDGWDCEHCHVSWNRDGTHARFTDDHGTDESLAGAAAAYDARAAEFHATTDDRRSPKETPTA